MLKLEVGFAPRVSAVELQAVRRHCLEFLRDFRYNSYTQLLGECHEQQFHCSEVWIDEQVDR